jgi:hypothetical protein
MAAYLILTAIVAFLVGRASCAPMPSKAFYSRIQRGKDHD